eukprot:Skav231046  [mRNA]  locus=scaffold446:270132:276075:- [translate_table: standard]
MKILGHLQPAQAGPKGFQTAGVCFGSRHVITWSRNHQKLELFQEFVSGDDFFLAFRHSRFPGWVSGPPPMDADVGLKPIGANDEGELHVGMCIPQTTKQVIGIGSHLSLGVNVRNFDRKLGREDRVHRYLTHAVPIQRRSFQLGFVHPPATRHQPHFIRAAAVHNFAGTNHVRVRRWIESAAIDSHSLYS